MKKRQEEAMKKLEQELFLLLNRRMLQRGLISKAMYEKTQTIIISTVPAVPQGRGNGS